MRLLRMRVTVAGRKRVQVASIGSSRRSIRVRRCCLLLGSRRRSLLWLLRCEMRIVVESHDRVLIEAGRLRDLVCGLRLRCCVSGLLGLPGILRLCLLILPRVRGLHLRLLLTLPWVLCLCLLLLHALLSHKWVLSLGLEWLGLLKRCLAEGVEACLGGREDLALNRLQERVACASAVRRNDRLVPCLLWCLLWREKRAVLLR